MVTRCCPLALAPRHLEGIQRECRGGTEKCMTWWRAHGHSQASRTGTDTKHIPVLVCILPDPSHDLIACCLSLALVSFSQAKRLCQILCSSRFTTLFHPASGSPRAPWQVEGRNRSAEKGGEWAWSPQVLYPPPCSQEALSLMGTIVLLSALFQKL